MTALKNLWQRLSQSKKYREYFVAAQVKQAIPYQIRALMKERGWSQEVLADRAGLTQGVVSRAANPEYGNLSLNTLVRIAAGFDVAFIGRFVPFGELDRWIRSLADETKKAIPFDEENARREHAASLVEANEKAYRAASHERHIAQKFPVPVVSIGQARLDFGPSLRTTPIRREFVLVIKSGASRSANPTNQGDLSQEPLAQGA